MPKKNKKKWIDPKSSSKFELVFRSQADPTYSETGNDRVLAPIGEKKLSGHSRKQHMDLIERLAWTEQPPSAAPQKPQKSRVERLSDDDEDEDGDWNIVDDLEGAGAKEKEKEKGKEVEDDARFADADEEEEEKQKAPKSKPKKPSKKANNKEVNLRDFEVGEYGFPMDGYDYSQHFKPMGAAQGAVFVEAPSSNKETAYRKPTFLKDEVFKIGKDDNEDVKKELFGVTPVSDLRDLALDEDGDLDPEILDALNNPDAFESLDDKFVTVLKKGGYGELWGEASDDGGEAEYYSDDFDEEDDRHMERDERGVRLISDLDTRPERGEQAQIFDERFERLMAGYDDDEIGELDPDDPSLQGTHSVDQFGEALDDFINAAKGEEYVPVKEDSFKEKFLERAMSMSKQEEAVYIEEEPERDAWDCESIISTYSNLENHPTLIDENRGSRKIRLSKKTGMPLGVLPSRERPAPDEPKKPAKDLGKPRTKGESKEEKKKRKAMVKETRRVARQQKKSVKEAFKEEEMRQVTLKVQQGPTAGQSVIKY